MSSPLPMRVFPPAVEFHGIEVGTMYFLTISIQNTGNTVRRVRFRPPSTAQFSLTYEPGGIRVLNVVQSAGKLKELFDSSELPNLESLERIEAEECGLIGTGR